eukprot:322237_1
MSSNTLQTLRSVGENRKTKSFTKRSKKQKRVRFKEKRVTFRINWTHIANCVQHYMYPKLANTIRAIINDTEKATGLHDVNNIDKLVDILKAQRHLTIEETTYLYKLHERAMQFKARATYIYRAPAEQSSMNKGLNHNVLQDIYDVHRQFRFSNYHFDEYSLIQFRNDIIQAGNHYLSADVVKSCVSNIEFQKRMNFYPNYIINDDMFAISGYIFAVSEYVHCIRNNSNNLKLNLVIIPKSINNVYDDSMLYQYKVTDIDGYLHCKNIYDYQRCAFRFDVNVDQNDIIAAMKQQYDIEDIINENIKNIIILIDRRHKNCSKDILYMFSSKYMNHFSELYTNYFICIDFNIFSNINNIGNTVRVYFRYGINEKLRFFPETLTSVM